MITMAMPFWGALRLGKASQADHLGNQLPRQRAGLSIIVIEHAVLDRGGPSGDPIFIFSSRPDCSEDVAAARQMGRLHRSACPRASARGLYTDPDLAFHRPWRASLQTFHVFQRYCGVIAPAKAEPGSLNFYGSITASADDDDPGFRRRQHDASALRYCTTYEAPAENGGTPNCQGGAPLLTGIDRVFLTMCLGRPMIPGAAGREDHALPEGTDPRRVTPFSSAASVRARGAGEPPPARREAPAHPPSRPALFSRWPLAGGRLHPRAAGAADEPAIASAWPRSPDDPRQH